jgi:hypothetical protein
MVLLKKPLGREATARPVMLQAGLSAGESSAVADQSARSSSPLAVRTAALLQRLHAQHRGVPERQASPSEPPHTELLASVTADLNRIQLTGYLGSEPLMYDVGDHPVATLALACERRWQAADGTLQLETTWVNLSAWEELAEQCGRLLHHGDRVYIEGSLHLWTEVQAPQSYACHTVMALRADACVIIDRIVLLAAGAHRQSLPYRPSG